MNATIQEHFAKYPEATFVITDIGHGYGYAKFTSTCPLTGLTNHSGRAIRKISGFTRAGVPFTCWSQHLGMMERLWKREVYVDTNNGRVTLSFFALKKIQSGYEEEVLKLLKAKQGEVGLILINQYGEQKNYHWNAVFGKWMSGYSKFSDKSLLATLRRRKSGRWLVV